jgi:hypothetical protein
MTNAHWQQTVVGDVNAIVGVLLPPVEQVTATGASGMYL